MLTLIQGRDRERGAAPTETRQDFFELTGVDSLYFYYEDSLNIKNPPPKGRAEQYANNEGKSLEEYLDQYVYVGVLTALRQGYVIDAFKSMDESEKNE